MRSPLLENTTNFKIFGLAEQNVGMTPCFLISLRMKDRHISKGAVDIQFTADTHNNSFSPHMHRNETVMCNNEKRHAD